MLKEIMISKKKVPVPIPVRTLQEALHWVGETFLKQDAAITVATLDEKDILSISEEDGQKIKLTNQSLLQIEIDRPKDLAIKTLETIHQLSKGLEARSKTIAVDCWTSQSLKGHQELQSYLDDLDLISELIHHLMGLVPTDPEPMAAIIGIYHLLNRSKKRVLALKSKAEEKTISEVLLRTILPLLNDLSRESEDLHIAILTS